ncbi:MAG: hypothetical protein IJJ41_04190 [Clostridia bacterium]|nr:hypothetical protein [Clostridia bacterium]
MKMEIVIAIISFLGTLIGTLGGIVASSRITAYRIEQLEKKVEEHNRFARRMPVVERDIEVINHRIKDLEENEKGKEK